MSELEFDFAGRTAIVTGAGRGIGLELSRFFAEAGASVYMVDRDTTAVESGASALSATALAADVSDSTDAQAVLDRVVADTGRVDVLVNNAGILRDGVSWKLSDRDWEDVLAVHLGGAFKMSRAVVPQMRVQGRGRIINVTSYSGLHGNFGQANYAAAKAGVVGLTKTMAKELAPFGITVNAISPNAETSMIASIPPERRRELEAEIPMRRFAEPREMSAAVGFLSSDGARYVTGVVLPVDGGLSM